MSRCYDVVMRTTIDLDDALLAAAKSMARDEGASLGAVISRLARRGLDQGATVTSSTGFPVFAVAGVAAPITIDTVAEHRDGD